MTATARPRRPTTTAAALGLASAFALALALAPREARAESGPFNLHLELGGAYQAGGYYADLNAGGVYGVGASLGADLQFHQPFAIEVMGGGGYYGNSGYASHSYWYNVAAGVRVRLFDDRAGYHNERGGNYMGNFWAAAHVGYAYWTDHSIAADVGAGYELSLVKPLQAGIFVRAMFAYPFAGSYNGQVDTVVFFGANISLQVGTLRTLDSDGDGVPDYRDRCRNTPHGAQVDDRGCLVLQREVVLEGITFGTDSADIDMERSRPALDRAVQLLIDNPEARVEIAGHTDNTGSEAHNQELSLERAQRVGAYMVAQGVNPAQITTQGYGSRMPRASNDSEDGRAMNRRIEFHRIAGTVPAPPPPGQH